MIYLIVDTRERFLHKLIRDTFTENGVHFETMQINTGDYLICEQVGSGMEILACIERKTLKDYAASFKDGRYNNTNKMLDLRDKTNCQLYYFVEGQVFLAPTTRIAGIPYKNIMNSTIHQMIRDNIHTVRTKDEQGTVDMLLDFIRSYEKIDIRASSRLSTSEKTQNVTPDIISDVASNVTPDGTQDVEQDVEQDETPVRVGGVDIINITKKIDKSDITIITEMWESLPGISLSTARNIAEICSFDEFLKQDIDIKSIKTQGGKSIIKSGITSLHSLKKYDVKRSINVLAAIPGISKTVATQLISKYNLSELIIEPQLSEFKIQQKSREVRFGESKANLVKKYLTHKI
jgi:ERCC4-type nuclease